MAKKKISGYKLKGGFPPAGKLGFKKRQRSALDFGRKRGTKPKMRGVFGVPGLGLQRPQAPDNKTPDDDPGEENEAMINFFFTIQELVHCGLGQQYAVLYCMVWTNGCTKTFLLVLGSLFLSGCYTWLPETAALAMK